MPGKLGADFNAEQPGDDDLVKKGASIFRDIKSRLKTFCGVIFNLETGKLKENVINYTNLEDYHAWEEEERTGTKVTVNRKGLVVDIEDVPENASAQSHRFLFTFDAGVDPDGDSVDRTLGTDDDGKTVAVYNFTIPAGVTKIHAQVLAAGGGGGYNAAPDTAGGGAGGNFADGIISVTENDTFEVWVGQGGVGATSAPAAATAGSMSKLEFDVSKYIKCGGGGEGAASSGGTPNTILDVAGINTIKNRGGIGTTKQGGAAGNGFPDNQTGVGHGYGGSPKATSPAFTGAHGLVVVTYWTNAT